jgi:hypothetical protein
MGLRDDWAVMIAFALVVGLIPLGVALMYKVDGCTIQYACPAVVVLTFSSCSEISNLPFVHLKVDISTSLPAYSGATV